jgi:hypothetical protein
MGGRVGVKNNYNKKQVLIDKNVHQSTEHHTSSLCNISVKISL